MAGMTNVANASVTIIPVMEGAQKSITEQLTGEATTAGTSAGKEMGKSLSSSTSSSIDFTKVGTSMTKNITVPLVAVGTASVAAATKFDTSFSKLSTIADTSEVSVGDLKKGIMELSNETGMSASAVAEAAYSAISAGQSTGNALKFVATSSKLAKGGFTDVSTATDVLTTALNAYGMEASEAEHVSDVLIATQNRGKTTVAELGASMGKVIPTASAANVSIEDLASQYVALTKNGIGTAESTTYINSMLNELTKSGSSANVAFEQATGQTFPEYIAAGHTTAEAMQELAKYEEEAGLKVTDAFGSAEAGKAANVLVNHTEDATDAFKEMTTQSGQAQAAFETMDQTAAAKMEKMKTSLENIAITLGDSILPALEPVVTGVANGIKTMSESFSSLPGPVKTGIMALLGTAAVAGPILSMVGKVGTGISTLKSLFGGLGGSFSGVTSAASSTSSTLSGTVTGGGFAALKNWLGQDMSSACSSFTGTLGTVGAAIGTFTASYSLTTWVLEQTGAMESLQNWATSTKLNLFDFAGGNSGGWDERYEQSCQKVEAASQGMYTLTSADLTEMETVQQHYSDQSTKWYNINKQESEAKANALSSYTTLATTLMGQEGAAATTLATTHTSAATTVQSALSSESASSTAAKSSITADQSAMAAGANSSASVMGMAAAKVGSDSGSMASTVGANMGRAKDSVTSNMSAAASTTKSQSNAIKSSMSSGTSGAASSAQSNFGKVKSSANSNMNAAASSVSSATSKMKSSFSSQNWGSVGSNAMTGIKGGITSMISSLASAAANAAKSMLNAAKSALGIASPSKVFEKEVGAFIPPGIAEGIEAKTSVAVDAAQASVNAMVDTVSVPSPGEYAAFGTSVLSMLGQSAIQPETSAQAAGVGDITIPVYIGREHIQDIVVTAQQIYNYRSGGR